MAIPGSFIKNVIIPLHDDYTFDNTPEKENDDTESPLANSFRTRFLGRKRHIEKFKKFLQAGRGIFLVTGYRGMGKTSFVNHVLNEIKNTENSQPGIGKTIPVRLTIAQNKPEEADILRQVIISIYEKVKEAIMVSTIGGGFNSMNSSDTAATRLYRKKRAAHWLGHIVMIAGLLLVSTLLFFIFPKFRDQLLMPDDPPEWWSYENMMTWLRIAALIFFTAFILFLILYLLYTHNKRKYQFALNNDPLYVKIKWLTERAFTNLSEDVPGGGPVELDLKGLKAAIGEHNPRRTKAFPIANSKELEFELKEVLKMACRNKKMKFVFVFDELDKIEFAEGTPNLYQDLNSFESEHQHLNFITSLRQRKQAVMNIIAGLKNFFTTSDAAFIFIAGREMFDASLADISDKQSPLSSIFTYTFNIESFLKEEEGYAGEKSRHSLTNVIEEFLKYQLAEENQLRENYQGTFETKEFFDYLKESRNCKGDDQARGKVYFLLQAFVTYLAYRSSGSPKKLLKAFHEFIKVGDYADEVYTVKDGERYLREQYIVANFNGNIPNENDPNKLKGHTCYLYFGLFDQYRICLINYIYRGFLIQHGRSYKLYSDNAIISVPYLFDHLFKFHPFAFSRTNLELVPEVLSSNKSTSLKEDLTQIIAYLGNSHLRDTDIELFEYKFNSRFSNELAFISRVFEEEAAAFNFTLDESYAVKALLNEKIKELRSIYSRFYRDSREASQQIFSIAYLNASLGDLHFFDQEFDDAIANYSDAVRPINNLKMEEMNFRDFVTLVKNKLKIALSFEKIHSYTEALMFYTDATQDAKRFIVHHLYKADPLQVKLSSISQQSAGFPVKPPSDHLTSSLSDLLPLISQGFVAKIVLQEKMGPDGLNHKKLKLEINEVLQLMEGVRYKCGLSHAQEANFLYHLGKVAYYKNSTGTNRHEIRGENGTVVYPEWFYSKYESIKKELITTLGNNNQEGENKRQPLLALIYYFVAMSEMLSGRLDHRFEGYAEKKAKRDIGEETSTRNPTLYLHDFFHKIRTVILERDERPTSHLFKQGASLLSSIGDCLLGCYAIHAGSVTLGKYEIQALFSSFQSASGWDSVYQSIRTSPNDQYNITDVFKCYLLSACLFERSGRDPQAVGEYKKILHLLRVILKTDPISSEDNKDYKWIIDWITDQATELIHKNSARVGHHEQRKAENYVRDFTGNVSKSVGKADIAFILDNLSISPEIRELKILQAYIDLKLKAGKKNQYRLQSSNLVSSQFLRMLELDYNMSRIWAPGNTSAINISPDEMADYLFCGLSLIRTVRIYGTDYMLGDSFLAYTHYRLARFISTIVNADNQQELDSQLIDMFGKESMVHLDTEYHYEKALDYYQRAIELHTAGQAYKSRMREMIFLEDDLTDNSYHFGAGLERYLMVSGLIEYFMHECATELEKKRKTK